MKIFLCLFVFLPVIKLKPILKTLLFSCVFCSILLFPEKISSSFSNIGISNNSPTQSNYQRRKQRARRQKTFNKTMNYLRNLNCTYEGNHLYLGEKGECYYYHRLSKKYIDPSYCSCYKKI